MNQMKQWIWWDKYSKHSIPRNEFFVRFTNEGNFQVCQLFEANAPLFTHSHPFPLKREKSLKQTCSKFQNSIVSTSLYNNNNNTKWWKRVSPKAPWREAWCFQLPKPLFLLWLSVKLENETDFNSENQKWQTIHNNYNERVLAQGLAQL